MVLWWVWKVLMSKIDFFFSSALAAAVVYRTHIPGYSVCGDDDDDSVEEWVRQQKTSEHLKIITEAREREGWEKLWKWNEIGNWRVLRRERKWTWESRTVQAYTICDIEKRVEDKYLIMEMIFNSIFWYLRMRWSDMAAHSVIECHSAWWNKNTQRDDRRMKRNEPRVIQTYEFSLKCAFFSAALQYVIPSAAYTMHNHQSQLCVHAASCRGSVRIGFHFSSRSSSYHAKI